MSRSRRCARGFACVAVSLALAVLLPGAAADADAAVKDPHKLLATADREFRNDATDAALKLYNEAIGLLAAGGGATAAAAKDGAPPLAKAYYSRHKVYIKLRRFTQAISDLTASLDAAGQHAATRALSHMQRANLLMMVGRCDEAVADYEATLAIDGTKRDALARLPHARTCAAAVQQGEAAMQRHDFASAKDALTMAMDGERAGSSAALLLKRAECFIALGEMEQALADSARAIKLEPSNLSAYALRGRTLAAFGEYASARTHFQECLSYDPEYKPCLEGHRSMKSLMKTKEKGEAAEARQAWAEAAEVWRDGLKHSTGSGRWHSEVYPHVVRALWKAKDTKAAQESAQACMAHDDTLADCHHVYGEILYAAENWEEAARQGRRAHELDRGQHAFGEFAQRAEAALKQSKNKDYYKILGVARNANEAAIKKAYRKLAREKHPDLAQDVDAETATKQFQSITEAYEILSDPEKRGRYDRGEDVTGQQQGQQQGHPFGGFPGGGMPFFFQQGGPGGGGPGQQGFSFSFGGRG